MESNKIYWADNLRALATFSVIILHVAADMLYQYGVIPNSNWWVGNAFDGIVRFSVPIFLMLTGALLFRKEYFINDFLKNKFLRIVIPFLFWSLIYILYNLKTMAATGVQMSTVESVQWAFVQLKTGSSYHFWYIYLIIGIYLFIPILGKWIRNATEKDILYFLIVWFSVMMLKQPYIAVLDITPNIDFTYFSGYLGYLVLGYYLSIKDFKNKVFRYIVPVVLIVIGMGITIFGTHHLTKLDGKFSEVFYGYLSPNVMIFAIGVFMVFKNQNSVNAKIAPAIQFIGKYSYGVYLSHVLVLTILAKKGISAYAYDPIIAIPLTSLICFGISLVLVFVLNKIPFGKYFAG
jgi:surface polysaccharide O-acyltransferase-like enzyme